MTAHTAGTLLVVLPCGTSTASLAEKLYVGRGYKKKNLSHGLLLG